MNSDSEKIGNSLSELPVQLRNRSARCGIAKRAVRVFILVILISTLYYFKLQDCGRNVFQLLEAGKNVAKHTWVDPKDKKLGVTPFPEKLVFPNYNYDVEIGHFLQITDLHYEPKYSPEAPVCSNCKNSKSDSKNTPPTSTSSIGRGRKRRMTICGDKKGGLQFGTPYSNCDSPLSLLEVTMKYIKEKHLKDLDFVVVTGDNGSHTDEANPKDHMSKDSQHRQVFSLLRKAFDDFEGNGKRVKVVFSIGNNDMYPKNAYGVKQKVIKNTSRLNNLLYTLLSGENDNTNKSVSKWIDKSQKAHFLRFGYYSTDIEETNVRIISLNTMLFYSINAYAPDCDSPSSPGYTHLLWLRSELNRAAADGRAVIIIGHIMPTPQLYKSSCFKGYRYEVSTFAHIIKGQLFGHVNKDVWRFVEPYKTGIDNILFNSDTANSTSYDLPSHVSSFIKNQDKAFRGKRRKPFWKHGIGKAVRRARRRIDDYILELIDSYKDVIKNGYDINSLSIASCSHSIIPRYQPGFKIFSYLKEMNKKNNQSHNKQKYYRKRKASSYGKSVEEIRHAKTSITDVRNKKTGSLALGTLLDYHVFWLNLKKADENYRNHNVTSPNYEYLYSASKTFGLSSLTSSEYFFLAKRLISSKSLQRTYEKLAFLDEEYLKSRTN